MSADVPVSSATAQAAPRRLPGTSRSRGGVVAGVLLLGVAFFLGGDQWLSILDTAMIAAIATLGLNVLSGYAGQISLGIAFFMGIGAYVAGWLGGSAPLFPGDPNGMNLSFLIWLPAAGIVAAVLGALIGPTALRLKGFYLGIVTLALVFIGQYLFVNVHTITGGSQGRAIPQPALGSFTFGSPNPILGLQFTTNQLYFLLLLVVLGLAAIFVANIARSRAGRAWQAVRDNEVAASIMGVNLFSAKMRAFVLSSFLAGIAGALWASYPGYTDPTQWSLVLSIEFVAAMLIGGVASVWGSILGAVFVFAIPTALETFSLLPQKASATGISSGDLSTIFYGALIIVFLLFEPAGLIGLIRRFQRILLRLEARREGGESAQTLDSPALESNFDVEITRLPRHLETPPSE
ncbi:MAG TPA: branched-chain amino acid ABC transporter permease [Ktedonobacterales bacterium]|nr:branched-chain amino acid ABC transporter permease [Ktedonobacterales bacterium]